MPAPARARRDGGAHAPYRDSRRANAPQWLVCDPPALKERLTNISIRSLWSLRLPPVSTAIPSEIEDEDARVAARGPLEHLGTAERIHRIATASEPTLLNGPAGKFVVF
jgi:hypothetical protein